MPKDDFNQTSFSQESPLFEREPAAMPTPEPTQSESPADTPAWHKPALIALGFGGILIFVLLGILLLAGNGSDDQGPTATPSPSPTAASRQLDSFEQSLREVEERVEQADPTEAKNPFPPVDMELQLQTSPGR
jgi:hypothetical protein